MNFVGSIWGPRQPQMNLDGFQNPSKRATIAKRNDFKKVRLDMLSAGIFETIMTSHLEECMDKIVCGNADQQVGNCMFHNGFMLPDGWSWMRKIVRHHVKDPEIVWAFSQRICGKHLNSTMHFGGCA